jgi:hypothetical protein
MPARILSRVAVMAAVVVVGILVACACVVRRQCDASTGSAMVIVEPRRHEKLGDVLENFDAGVDVSYDLYIFHGKSAGEYAREAARRVTSGRRVEFVRLDVDTLDANGYNALLKSSWFYNAINAENILVFQTDAVACLNPSLSLASFEKYGYIGCSVDHRIGPGAHWGPTNSFYGVGGLSFRKKSSALACLRAKRPAATFPEDVFFSNCVEQGFGQKPPDAATVQTFCTQNTFGKQSWGAHKPALLEKSHTKAFLEYCPSARIVM